MSDIAIQYFVPLKWPHGYEVTPSTARGSNNGFVPNLSTNDAVNLLEEEIKSLSPEKAVLYSDIEQLKVERLRMRRGNNPGISLEIRLKGRTYWLACDRWNSIEHNMYALHLILRNYRLMEKWGVADLGKLMQGFCDNRHTVSSSNGGSEDWMEVLGLGPSAGLEDAHAVYRRRAKLVATDQEALMILNNAMDQARKKLGN